MYARTAIVSVVICVAFAAIVALLLRRTYDDRSGARPRAPEQFDGDVPEAATDAPSVMNQVQSPKIDPNMGEVSVSSLSNKCNHNMGLTSHAEGGGLNSCNVVFAKDLVTDRITTDGVITVNGKVLVKGEDLLTKMSDVELLKSQVNALDLENRNLPI